MDDTALRAECKLLATELFNVDRSAEYSGWDEQWVNLITAFAKQQRAAGLWEAVTICEEHHAKDHWYLRKIKDQCETRAKAWEEGT